MMKVEGIKELEQSFAKKARKIKPASQRALQSAATLGRNLARSLAPNFTGALAANIISFKQNEEVWIIQSSPSSTDQNFPLNVAFDEGNFGRMTMWAGAEDPIVGYDRAGFPRTPFAPRSPSINIGFMKNTARLMREEFANKLNLEITRVVEAR